MKKLCMLLAVGLLLSSVYRAEAVEFKVQGEWLFGFSAVSSSFVQNPGTKKSGTSAADIFDARQRLRLKLEAVASESLSGVVYFEIGDIAWGNARQGGALGADGSIVELKNAYIDWVVPNSRLKLRMGLQFVMLPHAAGCTGVFLDDMAGITASYTFNDHVGLTALWGRPYNDNYTRGDFGYSGQSNYLDNMDLFAITLPVSMDGWRITPWVMGMFTGKNAVGPIANTFMGSGASVFAKAGLTTAGFNTQSLNKSGAAYSSAFWVGLPIIVTALEPWNFELDLNYGVSEGFGRYDAFTASGDSRRASSRREGWLVKGLAEYKLDWGTPGIFAWYGSGDKGVENGSGRMPHLEAWGSFTSFMGDNNYIWGMNFGGRNSGFELNSVYSGTWGVGTQLKDVSFFDNLSHTFRIAYWNGTNDPSMTKYVRGSQYGSFSKGWDQMDECVMYLTTKDWLLEFNVDSTWNIYDNLQAMVELGYIVNGIDRDQWRKYSNDAEWQKANAFKAGFMLKYSF